jgi:glucose-1-phosphate cytidylyltransferase
MKCVILAGGLGTRIGEETSIRPKPMVEVGGMPILWHVMKIYAAFGVTEFVICLGYKGHVIREFFADYFDNHSDLTYDFLGDHLITTHHRCGAEPWRVTLVDTGANTMTGGRLKRIRKYVNDGPFFMTYGDGVGDVDITEVAQAHLFDGRLVTLTAVQPPGRWGALEMERGRVVSFCEKPQGDSNWVNGGFFVVDPKALDYVTDDTTVWEQGPLMRLAEDNQLSYHRHDGFWQPLDTLCDKNKLESLWASGNAPWKIWP